MEIINLLIITIRADVGGGPRHVDLLVNNLSHEFNVFLSCPKDKPYFDLWISNSKVKAISTIPHRKFSIFRFLNLIQFCKKHNINIINSNGKGAGLYSRLLKIFLPKIKVIHTFNGVNIRNYKSVKTQLYFLYERFFSRFTDEFINVSNGEKEVCLKEKFFEASKSSVVYNCTSSFKNINIPVELFYL
ncbi:MAG: glycosyltransferase family 4 protein, partial [Bacteroidota bacterium]|nr:glycosyltransferase family 4 protein [Bacteroidota bacterium]